MKTYPFMLLSHVHGRSRLLRKNGGQSLCPGRQGDFLSHQLGPSGWDFTRPFKVTVTLPPSPNSIPSSYWKAEPPDQHLETGPQTKRTAEPRLLPVSLRTARPGPDAPPPAPPPTPHCSRGRSAPPATHVRWGGLGLGKGCARRWDSLSLQEQERVRSERS